METECKHCGKALDPIDIAHPSHARSYCSVTCTKRAQAKRQAERRDAALTKAQRLAIASAVAPSLRVAKRQRTITVVDKDGKPLRTITDEELALSMLRRADIELTADRVGTTRFCDRCRTAFKVSATNQKRCNACRWGRCIDCSAGLGHTRHQRCKPCALKARAAAYQALPPRRPCEKCGEDLWTGHKMRKVCPCSPKSKSCLFCKKVVAGHMRKGHCYGCYVKEVMHKTCKDCGTSERPRSFSGLCAPCGEARQEKRRARTAKLTAHILGAS